MSMWNFLINSMCDDNRNKKKLSAKICSEFHYRCFHFSSAFTQILPCCCCTVELIFFWFLLMFFYMQECRKWWICLKGVHSGIKQHSLNWECIQWQKNVGQQPRKKSSSSLVNNDMAVWWTRWSMQVFFRQSRSFSEKFTRLFSMQKKKCKKFVPWTKILLASIPARPCPAMPLCAPNRPSSGMCGFCNLKIALHAVHQKGLQS